MIRRLQYHKRKARQYDKLFFHPIVCHVCKQLNDGNTILCDCGMISYCCQEHMAMDRERSDNNVGHGEICDVVKKLTCEKLIRAFSGGTYLEWSQYKQYYMKFVMDNVFRELQSHEKQMILYARSCVICYKETDLEPCKTCFSIDYCEAHRTEDNEHQCEELKAWLYFEIQAINISPVAEWLTFFDFPKKGDVNDMSSFYETYVLPAKDASWTILDVIYSEYLSWPLTTYYGLQKTRLLRISETQSTYVIHIVEPKGVDKNNLLSWEIFLHIFEKPMTLVVIMIGLELAPELDDECGIIQTCWEKCMPLGHQLYFNCHHMLYNEYLASGLFTKPDVVIGFQIDRSFYNKQLWARFITSFKLPVCPIILTTKSKASALKCIYYINNVLPHINPILHTENSFKSLRPYRDHMTNRIFYFNEYLIVYMHINLIVSTHNGI